MTIRNFTHDPGSQIKPCLAFVSFMTNIQSDGLRDKIAFLKQSDKLDPTSDPKDLDVAFMRSRTYELHLGVYIGGHIYHYEYDSVFCERISDPSFKYRYAIIYYRRMRNHV